MKNFKTIRDSFLNAIGVIAYIATISLVMMNGDKLFSEIDNFLGPLMFLLLFVISALITSFLVLGRPIYLYFEGKKKEGLALFFYTGGWLILITVTMFIIKIIMA